jgi:Flp pilus assembly protein TadG
MRQRSLSRRIRQSGLTTVEFAIIGLLLMILLFGVIEFGRALFVRNALTEATRRGARMAAVCPVGDARPARVAVFDSGNGNSAYVAGLTTANIQVQYLDTAGTPIANPAGNFNTIHYVRVGIVGFQQTLFIPTLFTAIPMNGFATTLPRESLGITRGGVVTPC